MAGEKDATIVSMVSGFEALKKSGFPDTPQSASARATTIKELGTLAAQMKALPEEYKKIVDIWAGNAREQQALVSMKVAIKKARVMRFEDKAWRVGAGQAAKGVVMVATIATSIAGIIVSAGATAPIFVALASAGLAVSGISNIAQFRKTLSENISVEKKLMANITNDVETIKKALKPLGLAKHVTELRNLMKIREDAIATLTNEVKKDTVAATSYESALDKLKGDSTVEPGEIAKRQKNIEALNAQLKATAAKIDKLQHDNAAAQEVVDELAGLNVELDKISGHSATTLLGSLKGRFSSLDDWAELGNDIGNLVSASSGVHS
jgi:DNA repair exonuclease SbcCD ATPase subunit